MASQAISERAAQVPALRPTPALEITSEDISLSRIYLGQFMSRAVQDQLVKPGCLFAATGQDDPDPQVLWDPSKKAPGPLFYVLGLRKAKSYSDGGDLQMFDFDDPNAPLEAWVTYGYTVALPDVDEDLPYKLLLTRTGAPAAKKINTILKKNSISGPAWINAFRLTTAPRENAKGKYFVAQVQPVAAEKKHAAVVEQMALMVSTQAPTDFGSTGEQPSI